MSFLAISRSNAAQTNPTIGEISSERKTLPACPQSTPLVPLFTAMSWLAKPTPMMEPMSVWELDAGRPNHQVTKYHKIADTSRAKTIEKPAPRPTCRISSTGRSETTAKATAPEDNNTPIKFQIPDLTTATCGSSE